MKEKKHTVVTISNFNRKLIVRGIIDTLYSHIHDRSLFWLGTATSAEKRAEVRKK